MSISSSLYAGISGLSTLGNSMSVLGDNVSNVNTIAFKASRSTFQDVLAQSVSTAAGSAQVGRGVTLSTVDGIFAQGSFESTTNPTDLAIGGQGFFMLRAGESAEAAMYTRAGEFRFDQEGFLISPVGYFVQGWEINSATGERQGTIGDIYLGKSTPPVETQRVQAIVNLDSRDPKPTTTTRLFDAWNGTNADATVPTPPIDPSAYSYTSAIKVYDSQGKSHDITVYFARTAADNEWQYLVTCDPTEDRRYLSAEDQAAYAPSEQYNYQAHQGAGALMYGIINFSPSGVISNISAWKVPPDGNVDPALNTNRIFLDSTDQYYSFEANFIDDPDNPQLVEINFGAHYNGQQVDQKQIIVSDNGSDGGAYSNPSATAYVTKETLLTDVYDSSGNRLGAGYTFTYGGFNHDGVAVAGSYTIAANTKISDFLTTIGSDFGATAAIDAAGRLKLTDSKGGESGLAVTSFIAADDTGAQVNNPWGEQIKMTTSKAQVISDGRGVTNPTGEVPVITGNTAWANIYDDALAGPFAAGDTITFAGVKGGTGAQVPVAETFTVGTDYGSLLTNPTNTVQDLLTWLEDKFDVKADIDGAGRLVLTDRETGTSNLAITSVTASNGSTAFGGAGGFTNVIADTIEDGSRQGGTVSSGFVSEALASTQYANASTTIYQDQNGYAAGFLQSVSVDTDGVITGHFSNGQVLKKGQVALATFNNLAGLKKEGGNIFTQTTESGAPVTGAPGTNGLGSIAPNSLEQSNVDLGNEFVKLITTQRGFQANSKIITTTDEMLADLINIKR